MKQHNVMRSAPAITLTPCSFTSSATSLASGVIDEAINESHGTNDIYMEEDHEAGWRERWNHAISG